MSTSASRSLLTFPFQIMSIFSCRQNSYSYCSPIVIQAGAHIANLQPPFGRARGTFCAVTTNRCVPRRLLRASQLRGDWEADSVVDSSSGAGRGADSADPRGHRECSHDTEAQNSDAEGGRRRRASEARTNLWMWFSDRFFLHQAESWVDHKFDAGRGNFWIARTKKFYHPQQPPRGQLCTAKSLANSDHFESQKPVIGLRHGLRTVFRFVVDIAALHIHN